MYQVCRKESFGWRLIYSTSSFERACFLSQELKKRYPHQLFKILCSQNEQAARKHRALAYT